MRISRRFINLIPSVRIAPTRNTCIWKLRDTTWMSYMRSNFVKERNKKKILLLLILVGKTTFSRLNLSSLQIVDS